jgi:quercetin dioxygenase-like cupin family protein
MKMRPWLPLIAVLAAPAVFAAGPPPGTIQTGPEQVPWRPASAAMPAGTEMAVLEGDPGAARWFTIRLRVPAGATIPPHWHPRDERVTVLSGQAAVGFGETVDAAAVTRFGPGSFYVNPAHSRHYVLFPEASVVQVTGVGPWQVHFLEKAAPDPTATPASAPAP